MALKHKGTEAAAVDQEPKKCKWSDSLQLILVLSLMIASRFLLNELAILEFIRLLVEMMDRHFGNVCELDIMFHLEKVNFMLEEMVMNSCIVETTKTNILPNSAHGKGFLIYH